MGRLASTRTLWFQVKLIWKCLLLRLCVFCKCCFVLLLIYSSNKVIWAFQLQKRERSCRFFVQVFKSSFFCHHLILTPVLYLTRRLCMRMRMCMWHLMSCPTFTPRSCCVLFSLFFYYFFFSYFILPTPSLILCGLEPKRHLIRCKLLVMGHNVGWKTRRLPSMHVKKLTHALYPVIQTSKVHTYSWAGSQMTAGYWSERILVCCLLANWICWW